MYRDKYTYSLFQVFGVELEYMVVDQKTLDILPIVDLLFQDMAGEITSSIEMEDLSLDNELALHVVEMKTTEPTPSLASLDKDFHQMVQKLNALLSKRGACLLPGAMHPWMDPIKETKLWPHGPSEIYDTFNRIFNCSGHGWGNLQSAHLNLPFGSEEEFVKLHRAIRIALPLIPMIAASSPFFEGKAANVKDKRLDVYQYNCMKVPSVTGSIIPENCISYDDYQTKILDRIYNDLANLDPQGVLRHEWVNARGAITRFERGSIEVRLIDIQENPSQDLALISALTNLIKWLADNPHDFSTEGLKRILLLGIEKAEEALITDAEYLSIFGVKQQQMRAKDLWRHIITDLVEVPSRSQPGLDLIMKEGTLATRLEKRVGSAVNHESLHKCYFALCQCLEKGEPFVP